MVSTLAKRLITYNLLFDRLQSSGETKFPNAMGWTKLQHGVERQGGTDRTPSWCASDTWFRFCRSLL